MLQHPSILQNAQFTPINRWQTPSPDQLVCILQFTTRLVKQHLINTQNPKDQADPRIVQLMIIDETIQNVTAKESKITLSDILQQVGDFFHLEAEALDRRDDKNDFSILSTAEHGSPTKCLLQTANTSGSGSTGILDATRATSNTSAESQLRKGCDYCHFNGYRNCLYPHDYPTGMCNSCCDLDIPCVWGPLLRGSWRMQDALQEAAARFMAAKALNDSFQASKNLEEQCVEKSGPLIDLCTQALKSIRSEANESMSIPLRKTCDFCHFLGSPCERSNDMSLGTCNKCLRTKLQCTISPRVQPSMNKWSRTLKCVRCYIRNIECPRPNKQTTDACYTCVSTSLPCQYSLVLSIGPKPQNYLKEVHATLTTETFKALYESSEHIRAHQEQSKGTAEDAGFLDDRAQTFDHLIDDTERSALGLLKTAQAATDLLKSTQAAPMNPPDAPDPGHSRPSPDFTCSGKSTTEDNKPKVDYFMHLIACTYGALIRWRMLVHDPPSEADHSWPDDDVNVHIRRLAWKTLAAWIQVEEEANLCGTLEQRPMMEWMEDVARQNSLGVADVRWQILSVEEAEQFL